MGRSVVASPSPLSLEARRAAWDCLWRILLAPPQQERRDGLTNDEYDDTTPACPDGEGTHA
jgi:hypothetical protein